MTKATIMSVADAADIIVNGYAFTRDPKGFRVLNLNQPDKAAVFSKAGEVLETSMDDIELRIALDYYIANRQFLKEEDA
ncbi:MAG: hypothetical protein IJ719_14085 [Clostridia bacterium]|nr:hypothetical protein [Clostridia bacterium]